MEPSYPLADCNKPTFRKQRLQNFPHIAVTLGILIPIIAGSKLQSRSLVSDLHERDRRVSDSIGRFPPLDLILRHAGRQPPQPFTRFFDGMLFPLLEKPLVVRKTRGVFCDPAVG